MCRRSCTPIAAPLRNTMAHVGSLRSWVSAPVARTPYLPPPSFATPRIVASGLKQAVTRPVAEARHSPLVRMHAAPCSHWMPAATAGSGGRSGGPGGGKRWSADDGAGNNEQWGQGGQLQLLQILGSAGFLYLLGGCGPALAYNSKNPTWDYSPAKSFDLDKLLSQSWDVYAPVLRAMGLSGLMGMATAATLKWLGRTVLAAAGFLFITLQVLNYYQVITINWAMFDRSNSWFQRQLDHGIFSRNAVNYWIDRGVHMVTQGVPNAAGFTAGFLLGLKVL